MWSRTVAIGLTVVALAGCSGSDGPPQRAGGSVPATDARPATSTATSDGTVVGTVVGTVAGTVPATVVGPDVLADQPASAGELAAELSAVEAAIRAPQVTPEDLAAVGRRQQLAYRVLNRHPEWHADVAALVDPVAAGPLLYHLAARQASIDHAAGRPPAESPAEPPATVPAWTIVEPLPIAELRGYYDEAEAATGVPWEYLAAIHFQETRMGRVVGVSSAGAVGPMQFLPSTWARCCAGDPTVARDAILGAARYLVSRGAPADMPAALYGYNPNDGYVGAVTAYAQNMLADERAYLGYHGWEVFYGTSAGTVRLPVGYSEPVPVDVAAYLRQRPMDLLPSA
ncbi:MAG: lytic transglycosylase domain-containing protein [Actinomycetota bacterium]|nr:lytic transglycosylase domain-containing protein [Actinomycetota bacterium]